MFIHVVRISTELRGESHVREHTYPHPLLEVEEAEKEWFFFFFLVFGFGFRLKQTCFLPSTE